MNLLYTTTSYGVFSKFNVVIKIYGKIPLLCIKFIHEAKIFSTWFYTPLLYISEIKLQRRKKKETAFIITHGLLHSCLTNVLFKEN